MTGVINGDGTAPREMFPGIVESRFDRSTRQRSGQRRARR